MRLLAQNKSERNNRCWIERDIYCLVTHKLPII
jgi:hypothetical protein